MTEDDFVAYALQSLRPALMSGATTESIGLSDTTLNVSRQAAMPAGSGSRASGGMGGSAGDSTSAGEGSQIGGGDFDDSYAGQVGVVYTGIAMPVGGTPIVTRIR
jgi:hypothetical protein